MSRKLPTIITKEDFEKLFNETIKIEKKTKRVSKKNKIRQYRLAMLLGFEAGMRISEILGHKGWTIRHDKKTKELLPSKRIEVPKLTKDRVDSSSIKIIFGKGGKDRIVPRPKRMNESAVSMLPLTISRRGLQRFTTDLGRKVLNKEITFHTFRHGFCSHLAQTRPLHEVQMLAGHSRLDTTGIYLHANPKKAIEGARESF